MTIDTSTLARPVLDDATIRSFRSGFGGQVLQSGDADYDAARRVWNGLIDRRPALIARCANPSDVARAVDLAGEEGLLVAVRGGGHSAAGLAVCDGGLVIDLSPMRSVAVDLATRAARAGGGATWGDFDRATQAHGLATTGGAISTTGIGGLTLGGGLGWLMRSYGLACDNLVAAEVVTADGRHLIASADENADLYWGLRGGGGNFGVVTSFTYRLHEVGPMLGGMLVHPAARTADVLRLYRDVTRSAPDGLTTFAALLTSPDGDPIVALMPSWNGPIADGEATIRPLREFGPPVADQVGPMAYTELQTMLDEAFPSGLQVYWRSDFLTDLSDDAIAVLVEHFDQISSPLSAIVVEQLGGAVARVGLDETAFTHRDTDYNLAIVGRWVDPAEADRHVAWVRGLAAALRPFARGVYVNYLGVGDDAGRVRAAYRPETFARLAALKARYDAANLFRLNQNIPPTT